MWPDHIAPGHPSVTYHPWHHYHSKLTGVKEAPEAEVSDDELEPHVGPLTPIVEEADEVRRASCHLDCFAPAPQHFAVCFGIERPMRWHRSYPRCLTGTLGAS